jgi:hypothetical protein
MNRMRSQRGEGKVAAIFWILLLVAGVLLGFRYIPAKIADMELTDYMEELAQLNPRKDARFFRMRILKRAKELEIPLDDRNIRVQKTGQKVVMNVEYVVPMNFFIFTYDWKFSHRIDRRIYAM